MIPGDVITFGEDVQSEGGKNTASLWKLAFYGNVGRGLKPHQYLWINKIMTP